MRGEVGVSLFFVLSGCLLSLPFWKSSISGSSFPSLGRYARNRIARIGPAFWVNLAVCNILAFFVFNLGFDWKRFLSSALFINSYHYSTFFPSEINGPLWSIGLEVSCYALLPIILYSVIKFTKRPAFAFVGLGTWIAILQISNSVIIQKFMTDDFQKGWQFGIVGGAKEWLPYWNISTFFSQFLLGSMAALCIVWLKSSNVSSRGAFDAAALLTSCAAIYLVAVRLNPGSPDSFTQQPYVSPFFAALMAAVLVFLSLGLHFSPMIDNRLFVWIAKLSFSIYLWHMVIIEIIARKLLSTYTYYGLSDIFQWAVISTVVLMTSIALAALSWRYLEEPILKANKKRISRSNE
jgi:peptidoglycan/LPS O-acetylase OafA/YrhL